MKLTTPQAAERSGFPPFTIINFREYGILTDLKPAKDGAKKRYSQFDSKQVILAAKLGKSILGKDKKFSPKKLRALSEMMKAESSLAVVPTKKELKVIPQPVVKTLGITSQLKALEDKVNALHSKMDKLTAIWS